MINSKEIPYLKLQALPIGASATVTPTGVVTGVKPGTFSLKATKGDQTLTTQGFIMPQDWTVEFEPPTATVKVGAAVKLKVVAYDAKHQKLPPVPPGEGERTVSQPMVTATRNQHCGIPREPTRSDPDDWQHRR